MAVAIANIISNRRGLYFESTGDGSTTALTVAHGNGVHANATAQAFVVTAPTLSTSFRRSGRGGFQFPSDGTNVTVSSVSVSSTSVTVNTSAAIGNGTKAYVAVVFDQDTATH